MAQPTETPAQPPQAQSQESEHRPPALSERDLKWRQFQSRNPRFRMFMIVGIVVLLVAGFFMWRYFSSYESTDDAQIDGHMNPVSARVSGHVEKLLVNDNQYVDAGTAGRLIPRLSDRVARAKADYDNAVAAAGAAGSTFQSLPPAAARYHAAEAESTTTLRAWRQQYDAANAQLARW
jgi:membrane fusion protein (multidrug efflux system)